MARLTDVPPAQEKRYAELECPSFATTPWVNGPPLAERRGALISIVLSAGLVVEENGRSVRATGREIELGPERSSLRNQERKPKETSMHWHVSYRTGGSTVMHIFKRKEHAIAAAREFIDRGHRDALEVGPMLGSSEGNLLDERDIRRIWDENPGAATPDSTARTGSRTSRRT